MDDKLVKDIVKMVASGKRPVDILRKHNLLKPSTLSFALRKIGVLKFKAGRPKRSIYEGAIKALSFSRQRLDQIANPTKHSARSKLRYAVRSGYIKKPLLCQECLSGKNIQAHHKDYSRPFFVDWLCGKCHKKRHPNWNKKNAFWKPYVRKRFNMKETQCAPSKTKSHRWNGVTADAICINCGVRSGDIQMIRRSKYGKQ